MTPPNPPVSQLALTTADVPVTPSEVLADFADATPRWTYLPDDSRHYAEHKGRPALVLRRRRDDVPRLIDFAFASPPERPQSLRLVLLDAPAAEAPLPTGERSALVETFGATLRDHLSARAPDTSLHIERATPDA